MQATHMTRFTKRYQVVTEEKAGGATYTPTMLADFVAEQMVDSAPLGDPQARISILDPAVGDGALLLSLVTKLHERGSTNIAMYGFETDASAVREAKRRINAEYPQVRLQLKLGSFLDFVLDVKRGNPEAPLLFRHACRQFDFIIANPPYVRTQIMGAQQAQKLAAAFHLSGRVDLYYAFLMGIAEVLNANGTAGMIVSNRFMTTKSGSALRAALRTRFALRKIWDFGDTKLFDVAVLPAVVIANGRSHQGSQPISFSTIYETREAATAYADNPVAAIEMNGYVAVRDGRRFHVQHGLLDSSDGVAEVWRIATDAGNAWLATVQAHQWGTFGDIGKIRVGIKTCADRIFIRTDWNSLPFDRQPELLQPLMTHHVAARFRAKPAPKKRQVLYPHETVKGRRQVIDLENYPRSRAYLEDYRAELEARTYVLDAGRHWYELWVPHDPAAWAAPKLVFRDIAEHPIFWLDLEGNVVNGDCYWLAAGQPEDEELLWLAAAVANSTFCEAFYDHRFNNKLYAGRRRFITQYVEHFPLPDPETSFAREIIATARQLYAGVGTPHATQLEECLDHMVWQAFGLSKADA